MICKRCNERETRKSHYETCEACRTKEWRKKNPKKVKAYAKMRQKRDAVKIREWQIYEKLHRLTSQRKLSI